PDVIVICHEVGREYVLGYPSYPTPSLEEAIELHLLLGRRTNPQIRCGGISLNTSKLSEKDARAVLEREAARLKLPVADPMRGGPELDQLVDNCLKEPGQ